MPEQMRCLFRSALHVAVVSLTLLAPPATAMVINFDDIGGFSGRQNFPTLGIANTYQGFQWPSESGSRHWAVVSNADSQFTTVDAFSGTQAAWNWSDGGIRNILFPQAMDIDGAYFNVFMAQQTWGATTVQFLGYDAGNNLVGSSSVLFLDKTSAQPAWQWLQAGLSGVTRLSIVSTNNQFGGDGWWAMDDLTLSVHTAVPAPGALALLLLGLAAFGFRRQGRDVAFYVRRTGRGGEI